MTATCFIIRPDYRDGTRCALPRLADGINQWGGLLQDHDVTVSRLPTGKAIHALQAIEKVGGEGALLVYVGGHGLVKAGDHFTALDGTPATPNSINALWTRQVAELLAGASRDVVLFVDTCFAGASATVLQQALDVLAATPTSASFAVITGCRSFETTEDGVFVEALIRLMSDGPQCNLTAWGPLDEAIKPGPLVAELRALGLPVKAVFTDIASELRVIPNFAHDPDEREGRVHVKLRLRRLSAGAETHLLDKSDGFVGRVDLRTEIADWLGTASKGIFVVTGGPGTGKSALMGLLARQSVGDELARSGPCVPKGTFHLVVHARQKTLEQIEAELASVTDAEKYTILVDALDEAVVGESIGIAAYLRSLSRRVGVRIVVGTRPSPVVATRIRAEDPLLGELKPAALRNLAELDSTTDDIAELLRAVLPATPGSPYDGLDVTELAREIAERASPSFLFAQAAARWLTGQPEPVTVRPDWRARVARFGRADALGVLFDEDLAFRFTSANLNRVRDLLRALAWAEGLGLPRYTIWPELAEALSPTATRYGDPDITWVLNEAGWYITEAGEDGQTVYRLFHQALTDHFREETRRSRGLQDHEIQMMLVERLRSLADRAGGWDRADPYALHYLIAHAEQTVGPDQTATATVAELLDDPEFVTRADPIRLARAALRFRGSVDGDTARLLQRCVHEFARLDPSERLELLRLTALQDGLPGPPGPVRARAPWIPSWTTWWPGAALMVLTGHYGGVAAIAFSPDGTTLATASYDHTVRLWEVATGAQIATLTGHSDWVTTVAFSPDGTTLATASDDTTVRLWQVATGAQIATLTGHDRLAAAVAFSPDGTTLATASYDTTVRLWRVATGRRVATLTGHDDCVCALAFSPDGTTLATASDDTTVRLWKIATRRLVATLGHDFSAAAVAYSPDGTTLATASDTTARLWLITPSRRIRRLAILDHDEGVGGVAFSPDGATLATAGDDARGRLWNAATGQQLTSLSGHNRKVTAVTFSPDGTTLASASDDRTVRLWQMATGQQVATPTGHDDRVTAVVFSPDGTTLASASDDRTVRLWDAATGQQLTSLSGHSRRVTAVTFSPGGDTMITGNANGTVRLWEASAEAHLVTLSGHDAGVTAVAFSPDGTTVATGSDDRTVCLWSIAFRQPVAIIDHEAKVTAVGFSPDGAILATVSEDWTVRLWQVTTCRLRATLTGHDPGVAAVAFSPDGATLASAHTDGTVRLLHLASGEILSVIPLRSQALALAWSGPLLAVGAVAGIAVFHIR